MLKLLANEATIKTASVEVKSLTISGKQVTLAVFRQIEEESIIDDEGLLLGVPWGWVNYHPDKCADLKSHYHVVWQKGDELRRATIQLSEFWKVETERILGNRLPHIEKVVELYPVVMADEKDEEKKAYINWDFENDSCCPLCGENIQHERGYLVGWDAEKHANEKHKNLDRRCDIFKKNRDTIWAEAKYGQVKLPNDLEALNYVLLEAKKKLATVMRQRENSQAALAKLPQLFIAV